MNQTESGKSKIVSREEWLLARKELLLAEKELTRRSDELAKKRQELPWVRLEKNYQFDTDEGKASLADLFKGRSQLMIYHFMLGPDFKAGCPSCSSIADGFNGIAVHLANHDVMLWAVSRAPLAQVQAYKRRMGWSFPWASSFGSDFNYDFQAGHKKGNKTLEYNFRTMEVPPPQPDDEENPWIKEFASGVGTDGATYKSELPGLSTFVLEKGVVYHNYSAYARGLDGLWNMYQWLDRAPKGRNDNGPWFRRHDEYGKGSSATDSCCSTGKKREG